MISETYIISVSVIGYNRSNNQKFGIKSAIEKIDLNYH